MTPDVVVDIGNTRMKWGLCEGGRVSEVRRLPLDEVATWDVEFANLPLRSSRCRWAVASVNPPVMERFLAWARPYGTVVVFTSSTEVPIRVNVDEPSKVGLDRLFGAVAAKSVVPKGTPAITVDVGTAVTVNLIDADGVFQGGAIFPGPRLMGRALHEHTAKLPLVDLTETPNRSSGKNTVAAIQHGISAALIGGVRELIFGFINELSLIPWVFITGGGSHLLTGYKVEGVIEPRVVPTLTLEGIRIAAEALK